LFSLASRERWLVRQVLIDLINDCYLFSFLQFGQMIDSFGRINDLIRH
jgi:hypothetical protein